MRQPALGSFRPYDKETEQGSTALDGELPGQRVMQEQQQQQR
jgi:hypothetical protein